MKESKLSRRTFLKGSLAAGAAVTAASMLGACSPTDTTGSDQSNPSASSDVKWDMETEVVVVGFGGAGSCAAIEASKAGANVTMFETAEAGGGSTFMCGGFIYLGGTKLQEDFGVEDSVDEMYKYLSEAAGPYANQEAIRLLCDKAPETYDFCIEIGVEFGEKLDANHGVSRRAGIGLTYSGDELALPYRNNAVPAPRGHTTGDKAGVGFFEPLQAAVESAGVDIHFESPVKSLIQDSDGRVIGVVTEYDGGPKNVKASKAVILAGGGYGANAEMVAANVNYTVPYGPGVAGPNEDGSCIKMGQAIGADLFGMASTQFTTAIYGTKLDTAKAILVDKKGRRIVSETEYGSWVGRAIMQNGPEAYLIFDESLKAFFDEAKKEPEFTASTLAELADVTGVDALGLEFTVNQYNAMVEAGEDTQFGKEPEFLNAIDQGPFYAKYLGSDTVPYMSAGGLKTDLDTRVLDVDGNVIPGLYAAGRCSNLIYGHYMGSGTSIADCFTFGRIAGQTAATEASV